MTRTDPNPPTPSPSPAPTGPTRRAVLHSAWAAPVVLAAVAAPAAAASTPDPKPTLYVSFSGSGNSGYVYIELLDAGGEPLQQSFDIEGKPRGTDAWVAIFRPSTRADGTFASTIPSGITQDYSAVRIVATVPGYPTLVSEEQQLPFSA